MNTTENIINFFTGRNARPTNHKPQGHRHSCGRGQNQPPLQIPQAVVLTTKKALAQLRLLDRSLRLGVFSSRQDYEDTLHDLGIMLAFNDLTSVSVEVLDHQKSIVCEWKLSFENIRGRVAIVDSAEGMELPLLDRNEVAGHRFLIHHHGKRDEYRHLLKKNWTPAADLNRRRGHSFQSEHAAHITGGRQKGDVFVSDSARRTLRVISTGRKGYAFSKDTASGSTVWIHEKFTSGAQLRRGQTVTAIVVQTPRGFQARDVRLAS